MKLTITTFMFAILLTACNPKTEGTPAAKETRALCYIHTEAKDTVSMSIITEGNNVAGELTYKIFEKDRNSGRIQGTFSGDTLIAEYEFQSEGVMSAREVAFLKKGPSLVEGFGTMDATGTRFANRREISFTGFELHPTKCQ